MSVEFIYKNCVIMYYPFLTSFNKIDIDSSIDYDNSIDIDTSIDIDNYRDWDDCVNKCREYLPLINRSIGQLSSTNPNDIFIIFARKDSDLFIDNNKLFNQFIKWSYILDNDQTNDLYINNYLPIGALLINNFLNINLINCSLIPKNINTSTFYNIVKNRASNILYYLASEV